jgi:hypothetical protein
VETNFRGDKKIGVHQIKCQEGDMMSKTVFYKDAKGSEVATSLKEIPAKCADCNFVYITEDFREYDDLEGTDVFDKTIICKANKMVLCSCRSEGLYRFDYGFEEHTLAERNKKCPLLKKDSLTDKFKGRYLSE